MKLSELILKLSGELSRHGDMEVDFSNGDRYSEGIKVVTEGVIHPYITLTSDPED